jgi:tryptophan synthase alpha chain
MNRIEQAFANAGRESRPCRIIYATSGYPDLRTTGQVLLGLDRLGVDIIELGLPFSDPVADGPVIQETSYLSLRKGGTLKDHLGLVRRLRPGIKAALVVMTYANIVANAGMERFVRLCAAAGIDGFIIPDLPLDESARFAEICRARGTCCVLIAAETSGRERLRKIAGISGGFIYVVSRPGVTGGRLKIGGGLLRLAADLRRLTKKPLAVGFGISSARDVRALSEKFDGIIIGSAFLKEMLKKKGRPAAALRFVKKVFQLTRSPA